MMCEILLSDKLLAIPSWLTLWVAVAIVVASCCGAHLLLHFGILHRLVVPCSSCFMFTVGGRTRGSSVTDPVGWPSSVDALAMVFPISGRYKVIGT
jgi:hypothetical protein